MELQDTASAERTNDTPTTTNTQSGPRAKDVPADLRTTSGPAVLSAEELALLESIQRRILWLSTNIIHHANHGRPNPDNTKIGGHQASCASMISILTALYFYYLRAGDRVAVKPHASPAYHAVQYLLGNLPARYLTELRSYQGLQAYPSRTKDPDPIDFSTGSVGLGASATAFAALGQLYARTQLGSVTSERFVSLLGDAELDEGNVWETVAEEAVRGLANVLWIVDLNRQSLDRIIPGIKALRLKDHFQVEGWRVLEAKYGRRLQAMYARPGGEALRLRIDEMINEEYQNLIRLDGAALRPRLVRGRDEAALTRLLADVSDEELPGLLANLGGHDLEELLETLQVADSITDRPTVIFAYTIKGWGLPIAGHRLNHSALLSAEQMTALQAELGIAPGEEWAAFPPDSPEGRLCQAAQRRLYPKQETNPVMLCDAAIPTRLDVPQSAETSTQEAFGRVMRQLADVPVIGSRIVTRLAGRGRLDQPGGVDQPRRCVRPRNGDRLRRRGAAHAEVATGRPCGQHIELGISEMNLFMLLGMMGLSAELSGQHVFPVGTLYDPFVCRGLDALIYGLYNGSKFIFAGTPAGITLSSEGGAHQSTVTASLGIELPHLLCFEPGFGREVEWLMLEGLRQC